MFEKVSQLKSLGMILTNKILALLAATHHKLSAFSSIVQQRKNRICKSIALLVFCMYPKIVSDDKGGVYSEEACHHGV
jgi:hypothetical protein